MQLRKLLLLTIVVCGLATAGSSQNWQYVGTPYINQTSGFSTYLYFGDMEMNAAGDIFVGYWKSNGDLHFSKYSGGSWSQLPVAGTFPVSNVDIEVQGNDYYMGYSGVRGTNSYAFVKKFNGTSWDRLGDSVLLGNSGSGGWFEFVVDNNGEPIIVGGVSAPMADKQVMQLNGGVWAPLITIPGSNATVLRENSAMFDAQNKLICATQGYILNSGLVYFNVISTIDAGVRTTLGDTVFLQATNTRLHTDATGTPYMIFNTALTSKVASFKFNGSTWDLIGDTSATNGVMLSVDVSGDGKTVFNTLQANVDRSMYFYENSSVFNMDSVNVNGFSVGGIQDVMVPAGSNDVYILQLEIKTDASQDFAVMKHTITGPAAIGDLNAGVNWSLYPNPSTGNISIRTNESVQDAKITVLSQTGAIIYKGQMNGTSASIDLGRQAAGTYFIQLTDNKGTATQKLTLY
ncbi:MAG: T9SS type A sorting domain-containing protein [Sphingobacteriales bacterium]|nr:MAG: T9SS type A sorting domain-containing protein [Sphingobacteriales bacterium]